MGSNDDSIYLSDRNEFKILCLQKVWWKRAAWYGVFCLSQTRKLLQLKVSPKEMAYVLVLDAEAFFAWQVLANFQ